MRIRPETTARHDRADRTTPLRVLAVLIVAALTQGCLLLDEDLGRIPGEVCSFDIVDAFRCEGYKSNYEVRGMCKGFPGYLNGLYLFEGQMSWNADNGKVAERYTVEPIELLEHDFAGGEFLFTATCDSEPYQAGSQAACLDASFTTSDKVAPPPHLWDLVKKAKPVAVGQFTQADLAEFPLATDCKPEADAWSSSRRRRLSQSGPECEPERVPALFVTSPQANQTFNVQFADSLTLDFQRTRQTEGLIEIEWRKFEGRFVPLPGLPTLIPARSFPLIVALTDGKNSAGEGLYQVRVRPHDEACPRLWSFGQEFETINGGPAVNAQSQRRSR